MDGSLGRAQNECCGYCVVFLILLFLSEVVHVTQKVMLWIPGLGHTWVAFLTMTVGFF